MFSFSVDVVMAPPNGHRSNYSDPAVLAVTSETEELQVLLVLDLLVLEIPLN